MPTSELTTEDFIASAWAAAPHYGLEPSAISLLSHSENVVCELSFDNGDRKIMRLHRPGYNTLAELRSEVEWVHALELADVPVPTAVTTPNGDYYVAVDVAGQSHYVGVVNWVDGQPLGGPTQAADSSVVAHYQQIGIIAAKIRTSNQTWTPPSSFTRRSWDLDGFVGEAPLWGRFWEVPGLTDDQRKLFTACREKLVRELQSLPTTADLFGLIHSDLHLGNVMANGDELTVIDFDDAGFGWFVHEIAVALHPVLDEPWQDDARQALLTGYRSVHALSEHEEQLIDTFLTMRCMMIIGWLDARKELPIYEHFGDLAAQSTQAAKRYLG